MGKKLSSHAEYGRREILLLRSRCVFYQLLLFFIKKKREGGGGPLLFLLHVKSYLHNSQSFKNEGKNKVYLKTTKVIGLLETFFLIEEKFPAEY